MTQEEMWKAVKENNAEYDGLFFYAVKSTGIFCRPSCKSKIPNRENVLFFESVKDAQASGFRACKRCRSDLTEYNPVKEMAEQAKSLIDDFFCNAQTLEKKMKGMGVSNHHMIEVFKSEFGVTPKNYIDNLRLEKAKRLLGDTDNKIIDIVYSVGFNSTSAFYRFFKINTGKSPISYRKGLKND